MVFRKSTVETIDSQPLVSVLMNCYNGEKYLHEAIDSVLSQTYENWEIIFWDNQSTDQSANIFKSYDDSRLKYHLAPEHTNLGGGRAAAYPLLTGDFIAILDVDDLWLTTKLEEQLKYFDDPETGICITNTEFFSDKSSKIFYISTPPQGMVTENLLNNYYVSLETVMLRKSAIKLLECAFDPEFSHTSDFDLILRTSTVSKLKYVPKVLAKWRVHENSGTWQTGENFIFEKKKWISKYEKSNLFSSYSKGMSRLKNDTEIQLTLHLLNTDQKSRAKETLKNIELTSRKAYLIYLLCYLPFAMFIIKFREKMQRANWF